MGTHSIFSRGGQRGVWKTEVPQQSPGAALRWESGGEAQRSWRHFLKMMHKYFVYWGFRQHLQACSKKNHFNIIRGKCPLAMPAGTRGLSMQRSVKYGEKWGLWHSYEWTVMQFATVLFCASVKSCNLRPY